MASYKILVVEDEPDTRKYMSVLLGDNNYEVILAENAEIGYDKLEENNPDLAILDIVMKDETGRSGVKLYRRLRENEKFKTTPVIITTGASEIKKMFDMDRKAMPKPEAFFEKPVDEKELLDTIARLLNE